MLILAPTLEYVKQVNQFLDDQGSKCVAFSGKESPEQEREMAVAKFRMGDTVIAVTTQQFGGRGLDINFIGTIVLMRKPHTEELSHSSIGRTGRLEYEGKAVVLYCKDPGRDLGGTLRDIIDHHRRKYELWFEEATWQRRNWIKALRYFSEKEKIPIA